MIPRDSDERAALDALAAAVTDSPRTPAGQAPLHGPHSPAADLARINVTVTRPRKVTDAHRRDVLHLLSFGAMPFRGIVNRYAEETGGPVDGDLVRRTLDSLVDRGEVQKIVTRRPGQQPHKKERSPMAVYAVVAGEVRLEAWQRIPRRVALEDHLLALLCVAANAEGVGRTVLTCNSEAQAKRVMDEAKRLLSVQSWASPR